MLLKFSNDDPFATGSAPYDYSPATEGEATPRLILDVEVEGIMTQAFVDTGGVYLLCTPGIAKQMNFSEADSLSDVKRILFRGVEIPGRIHRVNVTVLAEVGKNLTLQATAFVPEPDEEDRWGDIPCVLGLFGCLERVRFAVDTTTETFYFGPPEVQ